MAAKQTIRRVLKALAFIIVFDMILLITTDVGGEQEELLSRLVLPSRPNLSALNCSAYGGPEDASEMVYWHDIPEDATFMEPIDPSEEEKYLSFELDKGGLNNIRMNLETVVALAHATRRTLVLPPNTDIYRTKVSRFLNFSVREYFTLDEATRGMIGVITMEEYLKRQSSNPPPNNRTNWDNAKDSSTFLSWIRTSFLTPHWNYSTCMLGFPNTDARQEEQSSASTNNPQQQQQQQQHLLSAKDVRTNHHHSVQHLLTGLKSANYVDRINRYLGNPVDVDATNATDRLDEVLINRRSLCEYTNRHDAAPHIHLRGDQASGTRLLIHFYAFLFFEDWRQDLWTKRLIRDKLRFSDEVQCAAARVVQELRTKSSHYHALHIRRGDFKTFFAMSHMEAEEIYESVKDIFEEGSTVYIASDESNTTFFDLFHQHYNVYFLKDFEHSCLEGVKLEYMGMIEQLIASRAREFAGCYYSTFTAYIHRMRGYHEQNDYFPDPDGALMHSWYYVPEKFKDSMQGYFPLSYPPYAREFPIAWRDINKGIGRRVE